MTGKGVDRHLFCLYVVSKYLELDSPFLKVNRISLMIWDTLQMDWRRTFLILFFSPNGKIHTELYLCTSSPETIPQESHNAGLK